MKKEVVLSQVLEDLRSGMTRWKKDDIGFGSLEKKYGLTPTEMIQLLSHEKVKNVESVIPTFVIIDDLPGEITTKIEVKEEAVITEQVMEAKIEVPTWSKQNSQKPVKQNVKEEKVYTATFI